MKEFIIPPPQFIAACEEGSKLLSASRGKEWCWTGIDRGFHHDKNKPDKKSVDLCQIADVIFQYCSSGHAASDAFWNCLYFDLI